MFPSSSGWVAHPDGKLYGLYLVTDPSVDPWTVESTPWRDESLLPPSIGTTTDGRLYGPVNHNGVGRLYELDPLAGTTEFVSEYDAIALDDVVAGVAARLYIGTNDNDTHMSPLVSYDPATGDWRDEGPAPFAALWEHAAHGPEGWIYVPDSSERLWARSPEGEWVLVELPDDLPDRWRPAFVDGGDGRLYAMDAQQPYVFTPGEVAEVPLR